MYDVIYDVVVEVRIVSKQPVPVYINREGKEVEEGERFGLKQDIRINHEHYLIFCNKSECQRNQKKDGHFSGTTYVVKRATVSQTVCSVNDQAFTILPFTSDSVSTKLDANLDKRIRYHQKAIIQIKVLDESSIIKYWFFKQP
jgi:hypothetical protein